MTIFELSACELSQRLGRGELSSLEIVEAFIARSREVDGDVRAFVERFDERAKNEARRSDERRRRGESLGPLDGVPVSIKENIDVEATASTLGLRARQHHRAEHDAVTVRVLRESGAVLLGKTNVPQTLLSPIETTNHLWGTTRNPWSLRHAPGGSSGGEAAAIASGQSVIGVGTDIGGSIRAPALFCGVAGLKPTLHRWSNIGSRTLIAGQETIRAQIGPLGRTSADVALLLRGIDSPRHSRFDPNVPPLAIADPQAVGLEGLRVGFYEDDGFFAPSAPVRRALRQAAGVLEAAGATLVPYEPALTQAMVLLYFATLSSDGLVTAKSQLDGEPIIEPLSLTWRLASLPEAARRALARGLRLMRQERLAAVVEVTHKKGVDALWRLTAERSELQLCEREAWDRLGIDAVLCPAHPTPPVPIGMAKDFTLSFCHAARYNVLNLPAGVVPVTRVRADETGGEPKGGDRLDKRAAQVVARSAGLPLGVQLVARPWREDVVLRLMLAIEEGARADASFPRTPVEPRSTA
jgi:fatty acid amide hydrolase